MENNQLQNSIEQIKLAINNNEISRSEVVASLGLDMASDTTTETKGSSKINLQKVFYVIGMLVIFLGIVVFVAQFWGDMSDLGRFLFSAVFSTFTFAGGYYFGLLDKKYYIFSMVFFFISALLFPLAGTSFFYMVAPGLPFEIWGSIAYFVFTGIFLGGYYFLKDEFLLLLSIIFASVFFVIITELLVAYGDADYTAIRAIILGSIYLSLAYTRVKRTYITWVLNLFGSGYILSALFYFNVDRKGFFLILMILAIISFYYISIKLVSKMLLVIATLFTFVEIAWITYEYFADSVGWPIALIVCGFIFIGVGYFSFKLNREYLKKS